MTAAVTAFLLCVDSMPLPPPVESDTPHPVPCEEAI